MSDCIVTCYGCRNDADNGPKVWRFLCEDCAQEKLDTHRRDTGHADMNLTVTADMSVSTLRGRIERASRMQGW